MLFLLMSGAVCAAAARGWRFAIYTCAVRVFRRAVCHGVRTAAKLMLQNSSKLARLGEQPQLASCAAPTAPTHSSIPQDIIGTPESRVVHLFPSLCGPTRMPRSLCFVASASLATALTLTTRSRIPNAQPQELQKFLATPANWPRIVLSSVAEGAATDASAEGAEVDELFGLPPILPLRVKWRCEDAGANTLDVRSEDRARRRSDGLPHGLFDRSGRRRVDCGPRNVLRAGVAARHCSPRRFWW